MAAIDDWIQDLKNGRYSADPQNLISDIDVAIAALLQIQSGLNPTVPQAANTVFAGPGAGAPALAAFRALVALDIPAILNAFGMAAGAAITPDQLAGLVGTTAVNNANAGSVGEFLETVVISSGQIPLTTTIPINVCSLILTPGDWDVTGASTTVPSGGTVTAAFVGGLNTVANTLPALERLQYETVSGAGINGSVTAPRRRFVVAANTTVSMVVQANFSVSGLSAVGFINARRVR